MGGFRRLVLHHVIGFTTACIAFLMIPNASAKPVYGKPVYNPDSKSYFELIELPPGLSPYSKAPQGPWPTVAKYATTRVYKGAVGRLAIVKSQATHDFIAQNLRPEWPAWIGLRYTCDTRILIWSDGSTHPASGYMRWGPKWRDDTYFCHDGKGIAPVFYKLVNGVLYWHAVGHGKEFTQAIIEYPTGQE